MPRTEFRDTRGPRILTVVRILCIVSDTFLTAGGYGGRKEWDRLATDRGDVTMAMGSRRSRRPPDTCRCCPSCRCPPPLSPPPRRFSASLTDNDVRASRIGPPLWRSRVLFRLRYGWGVVRSGDSSIIPSDCEAGLVSANAIAPNPKVRSPMASGRRSAARADVWYHADRHHHGDRGDLLCQETAAARPVPR